MNNEPATNDNVELDAIVHEQDWRAKVDQPSFAGVKYLVITELTIATLFAQVFVMRHQMSCCRFSSLPAGSLVAFWNPKNPQQLCCFIATTQCSTSQIQSLQGQCHESSHDNRGSYYALKGHSAAGQGGSPWSCPLGSNGSRDDQAGEAGPVEL